MSVPVRERALAVALLAGVMAAAYVLCIHPWFTQPLLEQQAKAAGLGERQQRVQAQLAQRGLISQRLQQARSTLAGHAPLLEQTTVELASAALVQRLEHEVAAASPGGRSCVISDRSPLPAGEEGAFSRVAVQVRLRCGTPELSQVLYALEAGSPALFIDELTVLSQRSANAGNYGLDVMFTVAGYLQRAPASTTEAAHDR